jgi:hypothetical protein
MFLDELSQASTPVHDLRQEAQPSRLSQLRASAGRT